MGGYETLLFLTFGRAVVPEALQVPIFVLVPHRGSDLPSQTTMMSALHLSCFLLGFSRLPWSHRPPSRATIPCMTRVGSSGGASWPDAASEWQNDASMPRDAALDDDNLTAFAAFSSVVSESPLLRQYGMARLPSSTAFSSRYKNWYAALAADKKLYARMTPEQRIAHDQEVAAKVAANAAKERARAAALEQAVNSGGRLARATAEILAEACLRGAQEGGRIRQAIRARSRPKR